MKKNIKKMEISQKLIYNLQFFADKEGKTEKATPRKRSKAREEGQVAKSIEINTAFLLIFMFAGLKLFGIFIYDKITIIFKNTYVLYSELDNIFNKTYILEFINNTIIQILIIVSPLFVIALIVGITTSYIQVGWHPTLKPLKPKFNKLNPIAGIKRLFSKRALIELMKAIFKVVVITIIIYNYIVDEIENIMLLIDMDLIEMVGYIGNIAINIGLRVGIFFLFIAVGDYIYQRYEHESNLKMTKEEVKEEYKMTEGNPQIKSKIKQKMKEISMRRMMEEIPKADVVITNPTHYAVAIKYDSNISSAPIVVAKGVDYLAARIKEIAGENNIEIVENKPLARMLYQTVDIGEEIPPELYQAVAEILAFVYSLKNSV
ncbi:flagellar biosynthesis protein FlhB [Defluviitalea phaphyphila]|uniref:flagellar biosynthesis protein FlhB n=1 Tax=Defluviitalea phaphyphila TaxID=1473580 RepID=UPI000B2CB963|nr:flagellar biosynthesis protein FlhB [Defluviitalea phaphyphila]